MRRVFLMMVVALAIAACGGVPDEPPPERLPPDGLTPSLEALLIDNVSGCRENQDCTSGICRYGTCLALSRLESPWQVPVVMARVEAYLESHPEGAELRKRAVATLARLVDEGAALAFRARAIQGLAALGASAEIAQRFAALPMPLQEEAAMALARLGDATGQELVVALTESEHLPIAIGAARALAGSKDPNALPTLLSMLSRDLEPELQRAAIEALGTMGDARAIGPLVDYLESGPDALADRVGMALTALVRPARPVPPDPAAWRALVAERPPPAPPAYTPRRAAGSEDDLNLPTP
ncbi:MAG: HEAT repeat domain-containing protein [Deltaproteobacteria bacterium]|nr:HEAT repeat domain-containing protein [Deltaproteobacteria bacterium]